jgi:peptidoglycan/xylan/chitin deacetylase (PgdA/CDA1 family)
MYHRVTQDSFDPWGLAVTPANFADQLGWLAVNRAMMPLTEFAARQRNGTLPANAAAVTFDDGYACFADVAQLQLERMGIPATVFLPVAIVERGDAFWWDELESIVLGSDKESLHVDGREIPLGPKKRSDGDWPPGSGPRTPRQSAFQAIWALLRPKRPADLESAMDELRSSAGALPPSSSKRAMDPRQVRELASKGVDFGSHALTHPWLASLDRAGKIREIGDSVDRCQAITGIRPAAFAYPYGNFDEESEQIVAESGFSCACTTEGRSVIPRCGPFALPRIGVGNWSPKTLAEVVQTL